ncbi:triphosphoribosyl-dephospho-CoA synthase [Mesorhizobium sp. 1B3]|uniref:triphosphoribosyl-dephospho-CoA synthase n=1 Tax=Mesorhizobium sp. 1B3 TaxID=3243599 RepID=UPI003D9A0AE5
MTLSRDDIRTAYEHACRLEIEALKPGNVHVFADGHRMTAEQFLASARASAGPLGDPGLTTGRRVLEAVQATKSAVGTNTNLGIILLCAPLMRAAELPGGEYRDNLGAVLEGMDMADTKAIFEAIVLASPGGLGSAEAHDVREEPKGLILEAMGAAADRDSIARQYVTCFADVFGIGLGALDQALQRGETGMWPAVRAYLAFLGGLPDSHIARKHGLDVANKVTAEAGIVRAQLAVEEDETKRIGLLARFDRHLKSRQINPGTSADLTVACLLVHLLRRQLA